MISKGLVFKGQYSLFGPVKYLLFTVLTLKKIRVKEGLPVLIFGSSKGVKGSFSTKIVIFLLNPLKTGMYFSISECILMF